MKVQNVTLLMTLVVMTSAQSYYGAGREYGRIGARLQQNGFDRGSTDQANQQRHSSRFGGTANQRARWAGLSALRDKSLAQNQAAQQRQSQAASQNFGRFGNNFGDIAKQIRNEALRNQYVIKDDAQYKRNKENSAQGGNRAQAKKTAFNNGTELVDHINYAYKNKHDSASSENGGFEEENGRNFKKLDLIDEREKDKKLLRGDSEVSRKQNDEQKSAKNEERKSNADQKQAQEGKYGFKDLRVDQAGERSDDRAVDYDRKDSKFLEQEAGKDVALRVAKELAHQQAGYDNEAVAAADANRNVADKKYYGGNELGGGGSQAGEQGEYGPDGAAQAGAALGAGADRAKHEGSGGAIKSGFDENAAQHERGKELAAAKAQSSVQAVNDYARNKDKLAYDQRTGLQDRSTGNFKQGLKDANSQGFSGNNAQAAKSAAESDKSAAASQSASNLDAKEKNENEALRDRQYFRKIQNDDSETFTVRKQFFHNKKEGGNNDEKLDYDRKKNVRNFGAADEAQVAKENNFKNLHQDGKVSSQVRNFEDLVDRQSKLQHDTQASQGTSKGFDNKQDHQEAAAQAAANGFEKALAKSTQDDSQSSAFNQRQSLQDQNAEQLRRAQDNKDSARNAAVDVEYVRPTNNAPLGEIQAKDFVNPDLLRAPAEDKGTKKHHIPDITVDIHPIAPPPIVKQPTRPQPLPPLPEVQQVKSYHPPKYTKPEVNYDTGRASNMNVFNNQPRFSRINPMSLFRGQRQGSFSGKQQATPQSRFSFQRLGSRPAPSHSSSSSRFGTSLFGNSFARRQWK